jgi:hypothetical protein
MRTAVRIALIVLSVATGAVFLYSAYTKFFPVQGFEFTIAQTTHLSLTWAKIAARFFVGFEAALGGLIALHLYGRGKWALKAALALLVIFSVYLVWLWATMGNHVNCGCFGDAVWMSPSASLIKNALLLIAIFILLRYHTGLQPQWANVSAPMILVCTTALPYFLDPVTTRYKIDLAPLYAVDSTKPPIDLTHGRHVIGFLNPQCMHCRYAGLKMHQLLQKDPTLPFYIVVGGTLSNLTEFWKDSQAQDIPHSRLAPRPFDKITGGVYPQIYWVNDGWVEESTSYPDLDAKAIERWEKSRTP